MLTFATLSSAGGLGGHLAGRVWARCAVALGVACALGCGPAMQVRVNPAAPLSRIDSVAVLDFEQHSGVTDAHMTKGSVVPPDSGRQVANLVSLVLAEQRRYRVVTAGEARRVLGADAAPTSEAKRDYGRLARLLGVDAIVTGRVDEYRLTYRLFMQRSRVRFAWWCLWPATGQGCWEAEVADTCVFGHERDLSESCIRKASEELERKLGPRPARPAGRKP